MSKKDKFNLYLDHLYSMDYTERPVSMETFLTNRRYLGKMTGDGEDLYPVWRRELPKIMKNDSKWQIVLTGAIGIGKTRAAVYGMCYILYRIMCLKEPWRHFNLAKGGKMVVVFFNLVKSQSHSKGYRLLQQHLIESPWFREKGQMGGSVKEPVLNLPLFEFKLASPYAKGFGIQGDDVITGLLDEVDEEGESEGQKKKVVSAYDSAVNRFTSRFVLDGDSIGRLFLVASKQESMSFLNTFIDERKNDKSVYVIDVPIWEAKRASEFSKETFAVKIGDLYNVSKVLLNPGEVEREIALGSKIIQVPFNFLEDFQRDPNKALRDKAGIAITSLRSSKLFPAERIITDCFDPERVDPIERTTILIGLKDPIDLIKMINMGAIRTPRNVPRFLHWDGSLTGDATGLAMSAVVGWATINKETEEGTPVSIREPVVETDFCFRLKAKPGDEIPFVKIRKLIIDLKKVYGFNIHLVTADLRMLSADSMQTLTAAGINNEYFSMDKNPQEYRGFRDICAQNRWVCFSNRYLHFELSNLEDDTIKNKIDHPDKVSTMVLLPTGGVDTVVIEGSKDVADAVAGSVVQALKFCVVPPDVNVMSRLLQKATSPTLPQQNDYAEWVIGMPQGPEKPKETVANSGMDKKQLNLFNKILKKAQG